MNFRLLRQLQNSNAQQNRPFEADCIAFSSSILLGARVLQLTLFLLLLVLSPLAANDYFYGNPSETCPQPFRVYTMADYLYWQASESGLEFAMKQQLPSALEAKAKVCEIDFPYKEGFRIGGGVVFPTYDWQFEVNWTRYFHNLRSSQNQSLGGNPSLIALWMHPQSDEFLSWGGADFGWDLKFDILDFDLLRIGFVNENWSLTPRVGLKRAWIEQAFHVRYENAFNPPSTLIANSYYDVRSNNDFRGIGPRIGCDVKLWAPWGFNLTSMATLSLLYGHIHAHEIDVSSSFGSVDVMEDIYRFKPMFQGGVALEWSRCFFKDESLRVLLGVGYEGQYWWGQNLQRTFVSSALPPSSLRMNGSLTLKGLDVHARFDF